MSDTEHHATMRTETGRVEQARQHADTLERSGDREGAEQLRGAANAYAGELHKKDVSNTHAQGRNYEQIADSAPEFGPSRRSTMPQTVTSPAAPGQATGQSNEVTGVASLVGYLGSVAERHAQISAGEAFLGSLARMDVGADDRGLVAEAQEASKVAAEAWKQAADTVARNNLPLREQYSLNPSAGNKDANTNE